MSIFDTARFVISAAKLSGLPPEAVPEIAFAGRSNAGKSTTINVLNNTTTFCDDRNTRVNCNSTLHTSTNEWFF